MAPRRAMTALALLLTAGVAEAGMKKVGGGAGSAHVPTYAEEKAEKERKKAERKEKLAEIKKDPRAALRSSMDNYASGESRAKKYMSMARREKKQGQDDAAYQREQMMYAKQAQFAAGKEMKRRAKKAQADAEAAELGERRRAAMARLTGRKVAQKDAVVEEPVAAPVAPRLRGISPAGKRVLGGAGLLTAAVAAAKVVAKLAGPSVPAPAAAPVVEEPVVEEPVAPAEPTDEAVAEEAAAPEAEGEAPPPGMSAEAAARLAESKRKAALLGAIEGQYALRGETCPLAVRQLGVEEMEAALAELRGVGGEASEEAPEGEVAAEEE